jgi:hypothetical protein
MSAAGDGPPLPEVPLDGGDHALHETALVGGDVNVGENVVVRVGDTVRRPVGPHTAYVHALLRHFERVGFDGAPRVIGFDERGREVLTYVEGEPALEPVNRDNESLQALGALLRRMHDAQAGYEPAPDWHEEPLEPPPGVTRGSEVVFHNDIFPPNVILRDGLPAALVDWDFAGPAPRLYDVASAANFWVPLRPDSQAERWGLAGLPRGERLRLLCDAYGLAASERAELPDVVAHRNRIGYELHRRNGGELRLPGWREMWDRGSGNVILERSAWFEANRADLQRSLA